MELACLPALLLPSFIHALKSSEFLVGISNNERFYLQIKAGPPGWYKSLHAAAASGHPARTVLFCFVPVLVTLGCFPQ